MLLRTEALTTIHYRIQDSAGEEVAAAAGCRERAEEQQSLLLHGMLRPSAAAAAAASHHECWSLNGQNRLGAHEWPGGGHLLVLLRRKPQHSSPTQAGRYPSSRFWLSVGELSGLPMLPGLPGMIAPSGSGQVQPCVVAAW